MNEYFSHDYKARCSPKLVRLMMRHGLLGIGAYWCVIEMLYEAGGYIEQMEYERIAYELRTDTSIIKSVIEDFELFAIKGKKFHSLTVIKRLKKRQEKSEKARQSVTSRWLKNKSTTLDTNVQQTKYTPDTNKKKEKEIKENINLSSFFPESENIPDSYFHKKEKEKNCAKKERNIIPPTLEMVAQYCNERKNNIQPSTFIEHYTAKGWYIGKEKMIDWQAAIRIWEQNNKSTINIKPKIYGNT